MFVPHRRWESGDYDTWDHPSPTQRRIQQRHTFAHTITTTDELADAFPDVVAARP
ncbi:hypothetical protein ACFV0T_20515 [Streptomyces sp. NPDC059582]|uniref:hypothetical protein n=1 Tax=Streptomyces sp. NPDC059582 TaxID=3346875 RepID=UPI0036CD8637